MCELQIKTEIGTTLQPYGVIYLATNELNGKVYVGQVESPRTMEIRWSEHIKEGRMLKRKRARYPHKKFYDTHLNNAIAKYTENVWKLRLIDTAYTLAELNYKEKFWIKKYDSMNPKKGYNMKAGGNGGKLRPEVRKTISKKITEKWLEPEYQEKQKTAAEKKWKTKNYQEKMERHRIKMSKLVKNEKKFLNDIKSGISTLELKEKYGMSLPTMHKNIERILGISGVRTCREVRKFLNGFTKKNVLTDIKKGMLLKELIQKYSVSNRAINRKLKHWLGSYGVRGYRDAKRFLQIIKFF